MMFKAQKVLGAFLWKYHIKKRREHNEQGRSFVILGARTIISNKNNNNNNNNNINNNNNTQTTNSGFLKPE